MVCNLQQVQKLEARCEWALQYGGPWIGKHRMYMILLLMMKMSPDSQVTIFDLQIILLKGGCYINAGVGPARAEQAFWLSGTEELYLRTTELTSL